MCIPPKLTSTVYDFIRHFNLQGGEWNEHTTISMHNDYIRYKNYEDNEQYKIYPQADGTFILLLDTIKDAGHPTKIITKTYNTIEDVVQYIVA
jgi:hypothetical protein